jgi:L-rhamnose mutarotase
MRNTNDAKDGACFVRWFVYVADVLFTFFSCSMKKIYAVLLLLLVIFPVYAQQDPNVSNLWDLLIRFCNDSEAAQEWWSKELKMSATPEKEEDICIYLVNWGPTEVEVELGFVDGTITNDAEQKKACQPESTISQFWQYVVPEQTVFIIPAKNTLETHAKVTFPEDTAGMIYGCATLKIIWATGSDGAIQVVSRRANFIDVSVKGVLRSSLQIVNQPLPVGRVVHNKDPRFYIISNPTTEELFGKVVVKNDGNVAQYVSLQPSTKRWWRATNYETISKKILPQQEGEFIIAITDKPRWNGPVQVSASITSNPVLEEWTDLEDNEIDMNTKQELLTTNTLFIPWVILFSILWLLFIWLIISGTRKKHK